MELIQVGIWEFIHDEDLTQGPHSFHLSYSIIDVILWTECTLSAIYFKEESSNFKSIVLKLRPELEGLLSSGIARSELIGT